MSEVLTTTRRLSSRELIAAKATMVSRLFDGFHSGGERPFKPMAILDQAECDPHFYSEFDYATFAETAQSFANGEYVLADDLRDDLDRLLEAVDGIAEKLKANYSLTDQWSLTTEWLQTAESDSDGSQSPLGLLRAVSRRISSVRDCVAEIARSL